MSIITWDGTGQKQYETGVDHGVLYPLNSGTSLYDTGVAWNGLTAVNEKPAGAGANAQYADNIKYLNLLSAETFGGTIEAFTYPDAFGACDGTVSPSPGVAVGQQGRQTFGLSYRTKVGTDVNSSEGYKLHLVYGALASPSEKDYTTINDSPAAVAFSWDFDCTPVPVSGLEPTCILVIDSTKVDSGDLTALQSLLYGTADDSPQLPSPDSVLALFASEVIVSGLPTAPTITSDVITFPTVTGVDYRVAGVIKTGTLAIATDTVVTATPKPGYIFPEPNVNEWLMHHT